MQKVQIPDQQFMDMVRGHLKYLKAGEELQTDRLLKPLGLDSMAAVDLLLDVEDMYGVTISDKYLTEETFSTAESLWIVVNQLRADAEKA